MHAYPWWIGITHRSQTYIKFSNDNNSFLNYMDLKLFVLLFLPGIQYLWTTVVQCTVVVRVTRKSFETQLWYNMRKKGSDKIYVILIQDNRNNQCGIYLRGSSQSSGKVVTIYQTFTRLRVNWGLVIASVAAFTLLIGYNKFSKLCWLVAALI